MTLVEKRQEKGQLWDQARKLNEKATQEKRRLTAEEQVEWDRLTGEMDRLTAEITREERLAADRAALDAPLPGSGARPQPGDGAQAEALIPERFRRLFRSLSPKHRDVRAHLELLASPAYQAGFDAYLLDGRAGFEQVPEARAIQADVFTGGGALVPPLQFIASLIQAVDDGVFIRPLATKFTVVSADALGVPSFDTDVADADWTSELATGSEGTLAFGRRELRPHPVAKRMKVSKKLLRAAGISVDSLILARLAYKFGITQEKAFLTGDGMQKPLGVFTASADGIPTSRDVSTDNTTTAITADNLINVKHSLKGQYWPRLRWLFHRDAIKMIRKLKDGNGQYLWAPGLTGGIPDRILESPYAMSEYAPNTFTTGLYVGLIGDFAQYWIADALDLTIQRLVELYAETNQEGFIGRMETDGAPVLAEAFARVKLA